MLALYTMRTPMHISARKARVSQVSTPPASCLARATLRCMELLDRVGERGSPLGEVVEHVVAGAGRGEQDDVAGTRLGARRSHGVGKRGAAVDVVLLQGCPRRPDGTAYRFLDAGRCLSDQEQGAHALGHDKRELLPGKILVAASGDQEHRLVDGPERDNRSSWRGRDGVVDVR